MLQTFFAWIKKYERHLSAFAMIAGFVVDYFVFDRVDILRTQLLLAGYAAACFIAIPLLQWARLRAERLGRAPKRWSLLLPIVTQFALGGFWSAFVIFYGRSADIGASWPFLLFLFLIFLGSEYFHHYHERLVFTSVLFFFALYSYAIFEVPIFTGVMGTITFLESGVVAIIVFGAFTMVLRAIARERFLQDIWRIRVGALVVLVLMNFFYFTNILPPLPLATPAAGVYHTVTRVPRDYLGTSEVSEPWYVHYLWFAPTLHVVQGDSLAAYSSIFAPTTLRTTIEHRWQWYDPSTKKWVTKAVITYPIVGGRDNGYRGYSIATPRQAGKWQVSVETNDGRIITRLPFIVVFVATPPARTTSVLK